MEVLYSMVVKPPQEISEQIKISAKKAFEDLDIEPHISLGSAFYCPRKNIVNNTKNWLEMQKPFVFTLRKVENFPEAIYLTSADQSEIDEIGDLYYGLKSLLETEFPDRQNNIKFTPHLTLQNYVPKKEIEERKSKFRQFFTNPIMVPITKLEIMEKVDKQRWKTVGYFTIGNEKEAEQLVTADEYVFGRNNRASVVPSYPLLSE